MDTLEALKTLAVALGCAKDTFKIKGSTASEIIEFIATNLPANYLGKK